MTPRLSLSRLVVLFSLWGLGSACFRRVPPEPAPHPGQAEDYVLTFINAGYTWCDATLLAWGYGLGEPYAAKMHFGEMLSRGTKLDGKLNVARSQAKSMGKVPCSYYESDFGYNDAESLAGYWGVDIDDAKLRISKLMSWQGEWAVWQELKFAQSGDWNEEYTSGDPQMQALDAFWNSTEVTTCDAELIAAHWGIDFYDAKIVLGEKVLGGWSRPDIESSSLSVAREHARRTGVSCSHWAADLNWDEMQALACFWGMELGDAKVRIGGYAFDGRVNELRALLPQAMACQNP